MNDEKSCAVCGSMNLVQCHEVFFGRGVRQLSKEYGCVEYLCLYHHTAAPTGIHHNIVLDKMFKRKHQKRLEDNGMTRQDFMRIFGQNYL